MKLSWPDIRRFLDEEYIVYYYSGADDLPVVDFCSLNKLKPHSITWIKKIKEFDLSNIAPELSLLIVTGRTKEGEISPRYNVIQCDNPKAVFFSILTRFWNTQTTSGIASSAVVETTNIGKNVTIGHNCYIGPDVAIGNNVIIGHNVTMINRVEIGDNTVICAGVVIGTDGFGMFKDEQRINHRVPHFGGVVIGRDVEIGANTCIDRGTIDDTIVSDNVKIDNLCQIAHNVIVGKKTLIPSQAGIAGSCVIGEDAYIAFGSKINSQIQVGKHGMVGVGAVVVKNVEAEKMVLGNPARTIGDNIDY